MLEINARIRIPEAELELSFARSSGPGGQNVNKVNSKTVLVFDVVNSPSLPPDVRRRFLEAYPSRVTTAGTIVITSDRSRDQQQNIADCREKLAELLLKVAVAPKKRTPTKPTRGSKERRLDSKRRRSGIKQDRKSDW